MPKSSLKPKRETRCRVGPPWRRRRPIHRSARAIKTLDHRLTDSHFAQLGSRAMRRLAWSGLFGGERPEWWCPLLLEPLLPFKHSAGSGVGQGPGPHRAGPGCSEIGLSGSVVAFASAPCASVRKAQARVAGEFACSGPDAPGPEPARARQRTESQQCRASSADSAGRRIHPERNRARVVRCHPDLRGNTARRKCVTLPVDAVRQTPWTRFKDLSHRLRSRHRVLRRSLSRNRSLDPPLGSPKPPRCRADLSQAPPFTAVVKPNQRIHYQAAHREQISHRADPRASRSSSRRARRHQSQPFSSLPSEQRI